MHDTRSRRPFKHPAVVAFSRRPFNAAVSDLAGMAEFYTYGNLDSTTTHLPYENETPGPDTKPIRVTLLRLDDLVASGSLRMPNLLKVDVEGHAHRSLSGARHALAHSKPLLVVAIHSTEELLGCENILLPLGYTRRRIETHSGSPDETVGHDFLFAPKK
jgi:FkbM family methyltransferase